MERRRRRRRRRGFGCAGVFLAFAGVAALFLAFFIGYAVLQPGMNGEALLEQVQSGISALSPSGEEEAADEEEEETIEDPEIAVDGETSVVRYYYEQLSSEEDQEAYQTIAQGLENEEEEITLSHSDPDRLSELFVMVLKDYPEFFWCSGSAVTTSYTGFRSYQTLTPGYTYDTDQRSRMQQQIDTAAEECLSGISEDAGTYETILHVYRWIVDTVEYDLKAQDNQNIYSALVGKKSVCAGYSRAFQYLLGKTGVFCTYVTGEALGNERHAWNLVRIGEDYYYVDVTWGDPVFQTEEEGEEGDNIIYDYMCCDDEQLFMTHTPDSGAALPACTHMEWNYYVVNDMYYTTYDKDVLQKKMNDGIAAKEKTCVFKFSNASLYGEAREEILNNLMPAGARNLARQYGLTRVKYQYQDDDRLNKITIFWNYD